jgi:type I restriction enzyme S subunit
VGDDTIWSWVSLAWDSQLLRSNIESRAATTAGQYNVSISRLADIPIPLPSVTEQNQIILEVEQRVSAANRLEASLEQQLARAKTTRNSLLREAFAGRLVAQDPKDEPASIMLKRFTAYRDAKAREPKGNRMSKSKSAPKGMVRRDLLAILEENGKPMTPEELFRASGHSQDSVEQFFAELRDLTTAPPKIVEDRKGSSRCLLRIVS